MPRLEDKIEKAIKPLIDMYEQIENDLLIKIAGHFSVNSEFLNSDYWRIQKLQEMGLFNQEVIEYIARYSNKTKEQVLKALNQIGIDTVNIDNLNRLFEDEVLKINPNILKENYTIKNMINTAYNELSQRFIQMSKQIEDATRNAYLSIVEKAYLETSMGTHSYQESIRNAIDQLGNSGLSTLDYKTVDADGNIKGIRRYDITSTVRREILTASRQLSNNINMEVANELECEYLYLSEHIRCRPEHFDWQGTIIKREDLVSVTDYGSITGLAGINCAHYFEPYFGDARGNDLKKISLEEATNQYKLSQKQRYLERGVRRWKRKTEMFKASEDKEAFKKSRDKLRWWQSRVNDFTEQNELRRDYTREYTANIKMITFNEDLDDYIKKIDTLSNEKEHLIYVDIKSGKQIGPTFTGTANRVTGSLKTELLMKFRQDDSIMSIHNHPNNSSLSFGDIMTFNNNREIGSVVATTNDYVYLIAPGRNGKIKYSKKMLSMEEIYYRNLEQNVKQRYKNLNYIERKHIVNTIYCKEKGWKYERIKKETFYRNNIR